ncbi:SMI1/KNR4 family protein [Pigmentiphaga aceris]|uniref:SMI1/KNR4 family protein n=1 Tax=Pigmentiphaga aceris TaxID=1940612 RepID=A0A5C0AWW2_9BURK|nr:SMI1/KNR4 family protein [Pigmentiphaga aceris]QEI05883.1 SMI1/KNR4 family protein [Pigmentiphaga aceris]
MNIAQCISYIGPFWHARMGANESALRDMETYSGLSLPADYKEFMKWSDGGAGSIKNIYLSMWSLSQLIELNENYKINGYLGERVIAIGSDGGPICFLLDYRLSKEPKFSSVNFGDLDPQEIKELAPSFEAAITLAISGKIVGDNL